MQNVSSELFATAYSSGADLVAQIPQQGIRGYHILRVFITNGPQTDVVNGQLFRMYKGAPGTNEFASVSKTDNNNAQFTPPEPVMPGQDVYGVWQGQTGFTGTAVVRIITDGGM